MLTDEQIREIHHDWLGHTGQLPAGETYNGNILGWIPAMIADRAERVERERRLIVLFNRLRRHWYLDRSRMVSVDDVHEIEKDFDALLAEGGEGDRPMSDAETILELLRTTTGNTPSDGSNIRKLYDIAYRAISDLAELRKKYEGKANES